MGFCSELDFEDFRYNGHHYAETPDGYVDDYDSAISRYIALCRGSNGECVDSNGSEAHPSGTLDNLTVEYSIDDHQFEGGVTVDGDFTAHGKLVKYDKKGAFEGYIVFKIDKIDGYELKPKKEKKKMGKVNEKDIEKRWNERVVPNGWHHEGKSGAAEYLMKYGKKISNEKLQGFADYARKQGYEAFASYMESAQLTPTVAKVVLKEVTVEYAERHGFNGDIIDMYNDCKDDRKLRIVETNVKTLADMGVGSCCGSVPNQCFKKIAEKYPNVKVRGCLDETCDGEEGIVMSAVDMFVKDEAMGEEISDLASEGGGSYRFDADGVENDWAYFETE